MTGADRDASPAPSVSLLPLMTDQDQYTCQRRVVGMLVFDHNGIVNRELT